MKSPLFSETYQEARGKFQAAVSASGHQTQAFPLPGAAGPDGAPLAMDTAWFGPVDARGVLLNLSGTHGAEGFAGSAAQINWIETRQYEALPKNIAVLMVHAVNPWGFAHFSRGTQNNVDLNRNWIDFNKPAPANPHYTDYHDILTPRSVDEKAEEEILRQLGIIARQRGQWDIEDAMSRGQYTRPDGLCFGGQEATWNRKTLTTIIKENLTHTDKVALIDWHTGTPGLGEIIHLCYSLPGSQSYANSARLWGVENIRPETIDDQWGNKRPGREGLMFHGIQKLVEGLGGTAAGGVVEIGTREPGDNRAAARASLYDRYLRFETDRFAPENKRLLDTVRLCYYRPDDEDWKKKALANSADVYARTLAGLKEWVEEE